MKIIFKIINHFTFICYFSLIFITKISYEIYPTYEEVLMALKEISYAYYMRGKNIQYNTHKVNWFSPEDATAQNQRYLVCSGFTRNVYRELLNITIPLGTISLLNYTRDNVGSPEVIAYSHINNNNEVEMKLYSPKENNKLKTMINPSLKDIIHLVRIGDILTYTGHTFLIYDVIKDNKGKVVDAIIMESGYGRGKAYVNTKITKLVRQPNGQDTPGAKHSLFLNNKLNPDFKEGLVQGTVGLNRLSTHKIWLNLNNTKLCKEEYSILRFIQNNSDGNAVLKYKATNPKEINQIKNNEIISLSKKNLDRIMKFKRIYIEKTVNAINNNIVEKGDILNYKIIIKNCGDKMYKKDLIIIENLSPYVTYLDHSENNNLIISFVTDLKNRKLKWNIGKLKKGQEFIINYTVKITSGKSRDIIESTGLVGNIPSSIIRNVIGINLDKNKMNLIKTKFDKLKRKYKGKKLINEIYREAFNYNMRFDEFDITKLIIHTKLYSSGSKTFYLNKINPFYDAVLNKYWSTLATVKYDFFKNGKEVNLYDLKHFRDYTDPERRQDYIYPETLKTGDILIYKNNQDISYTVNKNNKFIENIITYEEGEYAYIYIEGKGFVGVNIGDDGKVNTKDDRNEFNAKYYKDNKLELYPLSENSTNKTLEDVNMQTLFGKDYYVILRPSLCFDFQQNNQNKNNLFINSIKNRIKLFY